MPDDDPVTAALDEYIAQQESELHKAREFRSWWTSRRTDSAPVSPPPEPPTRRGPRKRPRHRSQPTLNDRIKTVLADSGPTRVSDIKAGVESLGWTTQSKTPGTVIRNTLRTLVDRGEVVVDGRLYFLPTEPRIPIAYIEPGDPRSVFHPPEREEGMG